jgi:hypothetical protein
MIGENPAGAAGRNGSGFKMVSDVHALEYELVREKGLERRSGFPQ